MAPNFSQQASGPISGDGNGNLSGQFTLSNFTVKTASGSLSSAVPKFVATIGKAEYDDNDSFQGTYKIGPNATIGPNQLNLPLSDDANHVIVLTGKINPPYLQQAYNVEGQVKWSSS